MLADFTVAVIEPSGAIAVPPNEGCGVAARAIDCETRQRCANTRFLGEGNLRDPAVTLRIRGLLINRTGKLPYLDI